MVLYDRDNNYEIGFSSLHGDKYVWNSKMFRRHSEDIVHALFHDQDGITWLGGPSGLMRYDSKIINNYEIPFNALVRSVVYGDSNLFAGAYQENGLLQPNDLDYTLKYSSNTPITFTFASTLLMRAKRSIAFY